MHTTVFLCASCRSNDFRQLPVNVSELGQALGATFLHPSTSSITMITSSHFHEKGQHVHGPLLLSEECEHTLTTRSAAAEVCLWIDAQLAHIPNPLQLTTPKLTINLWQSRPLPTENWLFFFSFFKERKYRCLCLLVDPGCVFMYESWACVCHTHAFWLWCFRASNRPHERQFIQAPRKLSSLRRTHWRFEKQC